MKFIIPQEHLDLPAKRVYPLMPPPVGVSAPSATVAELDPATLARTVRKFITDHHDEIPAGSSLDWLAMELKDALGDQGFMAIPEPTLSAIISGLELNAGLFKQAVASVQSGLKAAARAQPAI